MTEAVHTKKVEQDPVSIDALRVLVDGSDSEGWMAQGLEIDYFVCAKTEQSVKENFIRGLAKTVGLYLEEEGNINDLLKPAPREVWEEFSQAMSKEKKSASVCIGFTPVNRPFFNQVAFLISEKPETLG